MKSYPGSAWLQKPPLGYFPARRPQRPPYIGDNALFGATDSGPNVELAPEHAWLFNEGGGQQPGGTLPTTRPGQIFNDWGSDRPIVGGTSGGTPNVEWASTIAGSAVRFAHSEYITFAKNLPFTVDFSILCQVTIPATGLSGIILGTDLLGGLTYHAYPGSVQDASRSRLADFVGNTTMVAGQNYKLGMVCGSTNGVLPTLSLYVNGQPDNTPTTVTGNYSTNGAFFLGHSGDSGNGSDAIVNWLYYYARALTPREVTLIHARPFDWIYQARQMEWLKAPPASGLLLRRRRSIA